MSTNTQRLVDRLHAFTSQSNRPYVHIPCPENPLASRALPVRSTDFRNWYFAQFWSEYDDIPSARAFHSILDHLEARAFHDPANSAIPVFRRVAAHTLPDGRDSLALDLATPAGDCVLITADGWTVRTNRDISFEPSVAAASTPAPSASHDAPLDTLRAALNLASPADWLRCLAWLLAAFRPTGPHPILILQGPPNSGKSLAARILRTLVDRATAALAPTPTSVRELIGLARRHWVLALDHVSALSPRLADALSRLSSGLGVAFHEDLRSRGAQPVEETLRRPVILTVTDRFVCPPDLADRALIVHCPPIPPERHRTEDDISKVFSDSYGAILGALCSALSTALQNADELTRPASGTHCADALAWAIAAAPALGCTPAELKAAFIPPPPSHPLADALNRLLSERPRWTGSATDLLSLLGPTLTCHTPQGLTRQLRQNELTLSAAGIAITFRRLHEGVRTIELTPAAGSSPAPPNPTLPAPNSEFYPCNSPLPLVANSYTCTDSQHVDLPGIPIAPLLSSA